MESLTTSIMPSISALFAKKGFQYRIPTLHCPRSQLTPGIAAYRFSYANDLFANGKAAGMELRTSYRRSDSRCGARFSGAAYSRFWGRTPCSGSGSFWRSHFCDSDSKNHVLIANDLLTPPESSAFRVYVWKRFNDRVLLAFQVWTKDKTTTNFDFQSGQDEFTVFRFGKCRSKQFPTLITFSAKLVLITSTCFIDMPKYPSAAVNQLDNL